jgi:hypothetical protein
MYLMKVERTGTVFQSTRPFPAPTKAVSNGNVELISIWSEALQRIET